MNAKRAIEIISNFPDIPTIEDCLYFYKSFGYLAALEGSEVKALVEAVEKAIKEDNDHRWKVWLGEALARYREAVKK